MGASFSSSSPNPPGSIETFQLEGICDFLARYPDTDPDKRAFLAEVPAASNYLIENGHCPPQIVEVYDRFSASTTRVSVHIHLAGRDARCSLGLDARQVKMLRDIGEKYQAYATKLLVSYSSTTGGRHFTTKILDKRQWQNLKLAALCMTRADLRDDQRCPAAVLGHDDDDSWLKDIRETDKREELMNFEAHCKWLETDCVYSPTDFFEHLELRVRERATLESDPGRRLPRQVVGLVCEYILARKQTPRAYQSPSASDC